MAIVGRTASDIRDVLIEGESGILRCAPPWFRPRWYPTKRRLEWPNGAIAVTYSAEEPDSLRGPQHDGAICDEVASWRYPETWDQLMFGLRLGSPRVVAATTPRPTALIKSLITQDNVIVTRGSTFENEANLPPEFIRSILRRYEGTTLGRQELYAEILDDMPGALWKRSVIEQNRVTKAPDLVRIVVGVDPALTSGEESNETGIVVAGVASDGHVYVLDDVSCTATPAAWAGQVVSAYHKHRANYVVVEVNAGGEMVTYTLRTVDERVPVRTVYASRGKHTRAEPVAALYEQGKVHHVGVFPQLEDQMCSWLPGAPSPDRLDALVWAVTELTGGGHVFVELL